MKALRSQLKWIGCFWLAGASAFVLIGIGDLWMRKGWLAVQGFLSPFNIFNWIVIAMTLAPGLFVLGVARAPIRKALSISDAPSATTSADQGHSCGFIEHLN